MADSSTYKMTLSLNVLNHLGINLYSNVPAVLSEAVANAWDANAHNVDITIENDNGTITIADDGHGMTVADANNKYLTVGYRRREQESPITVGLNRAVMGRKGIGKLSLFSIAKTIKVYSIKNGERHGFKMVLDKIREQIEKDDHTYKPQVLEEFPDELTKGTKIVISDFKKNFNQTEKHLRRRLARRFSVIGGKDLFNVCINGLPISISDRDYFHKVQFLWTYNEEETEYSSLCKNRKYAEKRPFVVEDTGCKVSGWIGTSRKAGDLKDTETGDSLNKIVVMIRGKTAQEDILDVFSEGGVYSAYIIGEIHADFLDRDDDDDIATSSRQNILEDDPRFLKLKSFIQKELKHIQSKWTELRNIEGTDKAVEIPAIKEWYEQLGKDSKKKAASLFGKINKLTIDSDDERRSLLKHGILAFESLKLKENLDTLDKLDGTELEEFVRIFQDIDDIEATMYRQIVMGRLSIINSLEQKVDANAREKILQEELFDHLWLLDPGWERADATEYMEREVQKEFGNIDAGLTEEEKKGRVDIKYRTTSGKHLIIELKRADRRVSTYELLKQCDKYRKALRKLLDHQGHTTQPIEVICVIGRPLIDWGDNPTEREKSVQLMAIQNTRVVMYQELIESAGRSYKAYLTKKKEAGRIYDLVQRIES